MITIIKIYLFIGILFGIYNAYTLYTWYYFPEESLRKIKGEKYLDTEEDFEQFLSDCQKKGHHKIIISSAIETVFLYPFDIEPPKL